MAPNLSGLDLPNIAVADSVISRDGPVRSGIAADCSYLICNKFGGSDAVANSLPLLRLSIRNVDDVATQKEVLWIDATRIIAAVKNVVRGLQRSSVERPRKTMSKHLLLRQAS